MNITNWKTETTGHHAARPIGMTALALMMTLGVASPHAGRQGQSQPSSQPPRLPTSVSARGSDVTTGGPAGLNAFFMSHGVHLAARRTTGELDWWVGMSLVGYGYGEKLQAVGPAELEPGRNWIAYHRAGGLTEWYVNQPEGLEQGFTLESPPGPHPQGERLRLVLEVTGDLHATVSERGQAVVLKQADGTLTLHYRGLFASDIRGRALPAQMRVRDGHVILEVDDAEAVYPVTVDPTFTQQAKLFAYSGADVGFGQSLAIHWNTAVVGAQRHAAAESDGSNN
jgi:FG-GAP repeat protein